MGMNIFVESHVDTYLVAARTFHWMLVEFLMGCHWIYMEFHGGSINIW